MGRNKKNVLQGLGVFEVIEQIVTLTENESLEIGEDVKCYIDALAKHLRLKPMEALLMCVFINLSDDRRIQLHDIANHFGCRTVSILPHLDSIDTLVKRRIINRCIYEQGEESYYVPSTTLQALRKGTLPQHEKLSGMNLSAWLYKVRDFLKRRGRNEMSDCELARYLREMIVKNTQLPLAQRLKQLELGDDDLIIFLVMSIRFIDFDDNNIVRCDIEDYLEGYKMNEIIGDLSSGQHPLMEKDLIEYSFENGQANTSSWQLTKHSKRDIFAELRLKVDDEQQTANTSLLLYTDIRPKTMYYSGNVSSQVKRLQTLFEKDRMARVLKRLSDKGLRQGFTCLFYGSPGTGKTETVLQLARLSGRNVMMVDVPSIRSKWVGETERNIKDLFDRYRLAVKTCETTPILVFNEADALLNKRNEGSPNSVDKMENSMQNIILQEMENLEGIMIATTNLTGSLDSAFERRFLYKVEFEKPTPRERRHIWQSLLPDLSDDQSLMLAERYDFSGGQIENIARKRIIADILDDNDTLDINGVIESCQHEMLDKKRSIRIGFGLCG